LIIINDQNIYILPPTYVLEMKTIILLKKLERYALFTQNDLAKITNKSQKYVRTLLYRLNKKGFIRRIERGKYALYDDVLIFASYIEAPSYLSLWTALRYYNMTQQQPKSFFVMCPIKRKKIRLRDSDIIFVTTKHMFGYRKERYSDFDIFMAEPEKVIIDSLLFKIPLNDIAEALDSAELDFEKLSGYAKKTKNISLMKRLGYILENKKGSSYGLKATDNNYIPLDYLGRKGGKKERKWKLIINAEL